MGLFVVCARLPSNGKPTVPMPVKREAKIPAPLSWQVAQADRDGFAEHRRAPLGGWGLSGRFGGSRNPRIFPEASNSVKKVTTSKLPLLERVQKLSRKKQGAPPFIAASPPPPHAMLRGCGAWCACSASGFWPVPLPQARSRVPVCCICCAGMPGVCMMPGIVSVLAGLGVRSVILLAAVRVRVLCECVSDGSAVTRLLARACALHMLC